MWFVLESVFHHVERGSRASPVSGSRSFLQSFYGNAFYNNVQYAMLGYCGSVS